MLGLGMASPVKAASVDPIPVASGSQGCTTMAAYFGVEPGTWKEIRFTRVGTASIPPGVLTKTSQGNTITVTLTPQGTVDFTSKLPIEAVYVNKGTYPNGANAFYRYVPPVLSDTGLGLKPVVLSGVDHVVLCWATPTTTLPTTTLPTTTTWPTTTVAPTVTTEVVLPTSVAQPTTAVVLPTSMARSTTTLTGVLPETGGSASTALVVALALLLAGVVTSSIVLVRRDRR